MIMPECAAVAINKPLCTCDENKGSPHCCRLKDQHTTKQHKCLCGYKWPEHKANRTVRITFFSAYGCFGYVVSVLISECKSSCDFSVHKVASIGETPECYDAKFYLDDNGDSTQELTEAAVVLEGSVKHDGCMNFIFPSTNYQHLCGSNAVKEFAELFAFIHYLCIKELNNGGT